MSARVDEMLAQRVYVEGANLPFGQLTLHQVQSRAQELRSTVGWGPTARVAPVARAWAELAGAMQEVGVNTVGELPGETVGELAPRLWVVLPGADR